MYKNTREKECFPGLSETCWVEHRKIYRLFQGYLGSPDPYRFLQILVGLFSLERQNALIYEHLP